MLDHADSSKPSAFDLRAQHLALSSGPGELLMLSIGTPGEGSMLIPPVETWADRLDGDRRILAEQWGDLAAERAA